ncbi:hypothetical protein PCC82_11360 [Agrobacterium deltaense]
MAIYRNTETGDLIDAWMHSKEEDLHTLAFPTWLYRLWEDGTAYTGAGDVDYLKTADGDVEIPDGHYITRGGGGALSVMTPETIISQYLYEG